MSWEPEEGTLVEFVPAPLEVLGKGEFGGYTVRDTGSGNEWNMHEDILLKQYRPVKERPAEPNPILVDLRHRALQLAMDNRWAGSNHTDIVDAARAYFEYLVKG